MAGEPLFPPDRAAFQRMLLEWYAAQRRDLPWRGDRDPYHILVSEVMLQQTGVDRVISKYREFLERFPTLASLATASAADVLRAWQGMGYNRRALDLKRLAEVVVREHDGTLPRDPDALRHLPGIGRYTAHAVACFAYGAQIPVVDTNVRRVLSGYAGRELSEREAWELAADVLPAGRAEDWNQALMDYGATVYRARRTKRASPAAPFETTNRYWRGRIIDVLREHHTVPMPALLRSLPGSADEYRVRTLVHALRDEGMVRYDADSDQVALPE